MKKLGLLTLNLILAANCASPSISQTTAGSVSLNSRTPGPTKTLPISDDPQTSRDTERKGVPREFAGIDFKNFSYPVVWKNQTIRLKDGHLEYFEDKVFYNAWFDLRAIAYATMGVEGKKSAVVQLHRVSCGASCDGGAYLFYFYTIAQRKLKLLSRIEMGSLADDCGLRSFILKKDRLVLESFRVCRFNGISVKPTPDPNPNTHGGKFQADKLTRFVLRFDGRRFSQIRREVRANPEADVVNYKPEIEIEK